MNTKKVSSKRAKVNCVCELWTFRFKSGHVMNVVLRFVIISQDLIKVSLIHSFSGRIWSGD